MIYRQSNVVVFFLIISVVVLVSGAEKKPVTDITAKLSLYLLIENDANVVALSSDGKYLTVEERSGDNGVLLIIERISKKILHRLPKVLGDTLTFTPDGTHIVCLRRRKLENENRFDLLVNVHDVKSGKLLREIKLPMGQPNSKWFGRQCGLPYAVADDLLVVAGATEVATVYSLRTGKALGNLPGAKRPEYLSISNDGRWLLTLDGKRTLRVWDVKKRMLDRLLYEYLRDVEAIAISPDGKWCTALLTGDRAEVFDRATGGQKAGTSLGAKPHLGVAFTADGKRLVARVSPKPEKTTVLAALQFVLDGDCDWCLRLWDWQEGKHVCSVHSEFPPKNLAIRLSESGVFGKAKEE